MVFGRKRTVSNFLGPMDKKEPGKLGPLDRVKDAERPSTANPTSSMTVPKKERKRTFSNMASSFGSRLTGRSPNANELQYDVPYRTCTRSFAFRGDRDADKETVVFRRSPEHKVSVKRGALCALPYPRKGVIESPENQQLHASSNFPHSLEDLYVHCGIVRPDAWERNIWIEVNSRLEMWALDNPVSALHVMDLAKKWGLHAEFARTLVLTESSLWKKTRPAIREHELEKAYQAGDKYVDEKINRGDSKHVRQKLALRRQIREYACEDTNEEIFKSSDLELPIGRPDPIKPLPTAVVQLYEMITGLKIRDLVPTDKKLVVADWSERWPVYDHHLEYLLAIYGKPIKPVNLDPGYLHLCDEVGVNIVNSRARTLSNVSVDGREHKSVATQGSPNDKTLRVRNK